MANGTRGGNDAFLTEYMPSLYWYSNPRDGNNAISHRLAEGFRSKTYNGLFALMAFLIIVIIIISSSNSILNHFKQSSHQSQFSQLLFSVFSTKTPFIYSFSHILI